jgi:hypothetical protein
MTYLSFLPIGIPASSRLVFRNIYPQEIPVSPINLGGHFGFDEKHRNARFKKELDEEAERKRILREALYGLPVEVREAVTSQPEVAIERAAETVLDYTKLLREIRDIAAKIRQAEDDEDMNEITELIAMGAL